MAPGPNRRLVEILHTATAPHRVEFYLNNTRMRAAMPPARLSLLPSGTASNEALHAEVVMLRVAREYVTSLTCPRIVGCSNRFRSHEIPCFVEATIAYRHCSQVCIRRTLAERIAVLLVWSTEIVFAPWTKIHVGHRNIERVSVHVCMSHITCDTQKGERLVPPDPDDSPIHPPAEAAHHDIRQEARALSGFVQADAAETSGEHGVGSFCIAIVMQLRLCSRVQVHAFSAHCSSSM